MRRQDRARLLVVLTTSVLAGCGMGVQLGQPGEEPVPGAQSATGWIAEDLAIAVVSEAQPSPDHVLRLLLRREAGIWGDGGERRGSILGDDGSGAVIGFVRTIFGDPDNPFVGVDLRFELRNDGTGWQVVASERRYHCAGEIATELCQ